MGTGRRMAGFVMVGHDGLTAPREAASWLRTALAYVETLPPKDAKATSMRRKRSAA